MVGPEHCGSVSLAIRGYFVDGWVRTMWECNGNCNSIFIFISMIDLTEHTCAYVTLNSVMKVTYVQM